VWLLSPVFGDKYHYKGGILMRSKDKMLIVLIAVASLTPAACAGLPPAPTPVPPTPTASIAVADLVGVWYMASLETFLQFNEDGTFSFANAQGELEEAPFDAGQYQLEGSSLTFIANKESELCAGQTGSYEVGLTEEGQLQFVAQQDPCPLRLAGLRSGLWPRFEP
jgi:hypothetical protein